MATATATKNRTTATYRSATALPEDVQLRRAARQKARRERQKAQRLYKFRLTLYRLFCWLELLPRRIAEGTATVFTCFIVLVLMAAVFFAALGVLELALGFWASCIPG